MAPPRPKHNRLHSRQRRRRRRNLHQVEHPSTPPNMTTRKWRSSSRASAKSSNKGGGRTTSPAPRKYATSVESPVISWLNVHYLVIRSEDRRVGKDSSVSRVVRYGLRVLLMQSLKCLL